MDIQKYRATKKNKMVSIVADNVGTFTISYNRFNPITGEKEFEKLEVVSLADIGGDIDEARASLDALTALHDELLATNPPKVTQV